MGGQETFSPDHPFRNSAEMKTVISCHFQSKKHAQRAIETFKMPLNSSMFQSKQLWQEKQKSP